MTDTVDVAAITAAANERAGKITALCTTEGFPALAAAFINSDKDVAAVQARLTECKAIKAAVETGRKTCSALPPTLAGEYIAAGSDLQHAQADMFERIAAAQEASGSQTTAHAALPPSSDRAAGWNKAIARVNSRIERSSPHARASNPVPPAV